MTAAEAFKPLSDFQRDAHLLLSIAGDLDRDVMEGPIGDDLDADLEAWSMLEDANRLLGIVRAAVADRLAQAFPVDEEGKGLKRVDIAGVGSFEKHRKKDRTQWEKDDLLRAVLDSRVVDDQTGEIESPLDKVLSVWNLGSPRLTALKARGIDGDQFCHVEVGGFTLQKVG